MSEEIILNRVEKEILELRSVIKRRDNLLRILKNERDIKIVKEARNQEKNILYVLEKIKRYRSVPLAIDYLKKGKE